MKRFIFLWLLSICILPGAMAQDNGQPGDLPVAKPVSQGVWVYLGNRLPKNMHYQIERKKENTQRYEKIGDVTAPVSEMEIEKRQQSYQKYFESLDALSTAEIKNLWQGLQSHTTIDSMYNNNLPMMHLLAGTAFFDNTADKNSAYFYRVTLLNTDNKNISQKESNVSSSIKMVSLPKINFSGKRYADGKLSLTWAVKDKIDMAHFNIYRTVFGKDDFHRIKIEKGIYSDKDSLKLMGIDSLGKQPAWYEYKIAPVDAFGNEGEMQGYVNGGNLQDYYAPPVTNFRVVNTHQNHEVKLAWHFENKKYLNGVAIMRSLMYDSGYKRIATVPVDDSVFTDILPVSGENYYYYLLLFSANNDPVPTAKIFATYTDENAKPEPPNEIDATNIANGIKVYWKSEEPFGKGFYVYRRNNPQDEFTQVSPLMPVGSAVYSFTDTSRQLQAGEVYEYVVRTINENNQLSNPSDTVTANPGIKKAIAAPMNLRYRNDDDRITLLWDDMRPWENDLLGYKVFRKTGNGNFERMANDSLQPTKNFYIDSTLQKGISYSYAVSAIDISGNESEKSTIVTPAIVEHLPASPSGITLSQTGNEIYISWGQIAGDIASIKIYRSETGQPAKIIGTVNDADSFTDKNVSKGKLYFYQLASVNNKNKEGLLSEKVAVRVR
ncbi:MAG TPA: hypothetical protein PK872_03515 [Ferruginibacter sp.]|nr:hypothetical protein [Ferruginibacter sp.]